MPSSQITAEDVADWNSLEEIADCFEQKKDLKKRDGLSDRDDEVVLEIDDGEFMILIESEPNRSASDYQSRTNARRRTNFVATPDYQSFTFTTRKRSFDEHGAINFQQFSFDKDEIVSDSGKKFSKLEKINELEYGEPYKIYELYDTREVVDEFYEEFEDLRTDLIREVSGIDEDREDAKERFVQLQLDRLIFLHFIQEKDLLDFNRNYLEDILQSAVNENKDVYESKLEPLYFSVLGEGSDRKEFGNVPHLNGGLFTKSPIESEFPEAKLGNSKQETNDLYREILDFLGDWNWHVDERLDVVDEKNLSPEVLGHIFEQTVTQKEKGAYYTPEEVTSYIAWNTVHPYLLNQINERVGESYEGLDEVFGLDSNGSEDRAVADGGIAKTGTAESIRTDHVETLYFDILKDMSVLDPAVGSGAFLLAVQEVLLDTYLSCIEHFQDTELFERTGRVQNELEKIEANGSPTLFAKHEIILNNLYGVDIDQGAVEICKLRLWLSMVADIENDPSEVEPLPNIDFNIRQGNTLIGYTELIDTTSKGDSELVNWGGGIGKSVEERYEEIIEAIDNYKDATTGSKANKWRNEAEERLSKHRKSLDEKVLQNFEEVGVSIDSEELDEHSPFHYILEFAEVYSKGGGFDVIVGNPPYIRIQELKKTQPKVIEYLGESEEYDTPYYNYDIAIPFTERSHDLLSEQGRMSFIMTNKWLQSRYGGKLREKLANEKTVSSLIDFGDQQVFRGISTYVLILSLTNSENDHIDYAEVDGIGEDLGVRLDEINRRENNEYVSTFESSYGTLDDNPWSFVPKKQANILEHISEYENLGQVCRRIFVGCQTSRDKIYILDKTGETQDTYRGYSEALDREVEIEREMTKPLLKGDEFNKWKTTDSEHIIIYPYRISTDGNSPEANLIPLSEIRNKYPQTAEYLEANREELESRDRGEWENEEKWHRFGRRQNVDQFEEEKIMTSVLNKQSKFSLDENQKFVFVGGGNAGGYGIKISRSEDITREYLLSILNSRLLEWNIQKISSQFRGGYFSYGKKYIENLPILKSDDYDHLFESLSKSLVYLTELDSSCKELVEDLENLIDVAVYELYFDRFDESVVPIIEKEVSKITADDKDELRNIVEKLISDEDFVSGVRRIYDDEWVKIVDEGKLREDRFKEL